MARTVVLTGEAIARFEEAAQKWWQEKEKTGIPKATKIAEELLWDDRVVQKLLKRLPNERNMLIALFREQVARQATTYAPTIHLWELTEDDFGMKPNDEIACQLLTEGFHLYHGAAYAAAKEKYNEALCLLPRTERIDLLASAYFRLGEVALAIGEDTEALQLAQRSLTCCAEKSLPLLSADVYSLLAALYLRKGDLSEGRKAYKISIDYCEKTGHLHGTIWAELGLVSVETEAGQLATANLHLERASTLIQIIKNPALKAALTFREARLRLREGDQVAASCLVEQGFAFWQAVEHPRWLALGWLLRAEIADAASHKENGLQFALSSLRLYESVGDKYGMEQAKALVSAQNLEEPTP